MQTVASEINTGLLNYFITIKLQVMFVWTLATAEMLRQFGIRITLL